MRGEYYSNKTFSGTPFTRTDLTIDFDWQEGSPDPFIPADNFSVRWSGTLLPSTTGVHQVFVIVDDGVKLYIDGRLLIEEWKEQAPTEYSVSVALTNGYPHQIVMEYFEQAGGAVARLQWREPGVSTASVLAREKAAAAESETVIAVLGLSPAYEGENLDRATINLPADQQQYLQELFAVNSNIIVVLENGGPLAVNWMQTNIPAIVAFWYHGEQGGNALADVLFGDYNPAGRLPMTWYASDSQLPPLSDYEIKQGRTYMYLDTPPLYPFGHGLSYTTFEYDNLQLSTNQAGVDDTIDISFDVKNTGDRAGDEVVQLYVRDVESSVYQPLKQLKDFTKIHLGTNEIKQVTFSLPVRSLSFWALETNMFVVESGLFDVLAGASSEDIRLSNVVAVSSWYTNSMTNVVATVTKIQFDLGTAGGIYAGTESPGHAGGIFSSSDTNWNGMGSTLDVSGGLVGADGVHEPGLKFQATAVSNNTLFSWSPCEKVWVSTVAAGEGIYGTALMEDRYEVDRPQHDLGVRVSGLPVGVYQIWALVRLNDQTDKEFAFSIGTNITILTPPYLTATSSAGVEQWVAGVNYVTDTVTVESPEDWITVLCVRTDSWKMGAMTGMQIALVPEPSLMVISGITLLMCLRGKKFG